MATQVDTVRSAVQGSVRTRTAQACLVLRSAHLRLHDLGADAQEHLRSELVRTQHAARLRAALGQNEQVAEFDRRPYQLGRKALHARVDSTCSSMRELRRKMGDLAELGCLTPTPFGWLLKHNVWLTT
jgi:hypothetical protein